MIRFIITGYDKKVVVHCQNKVRNGAFNLTNNNTRRTYQSDIRHFVQSGATLPANFDDLLRYLQHYAATLNPRTLDGEWHLTVIKNWYII